MVALAITAHEYAHGREKIKGIVDYYSSHAAWKIHRDALSQPFVLSETLLGWEGDGVIGEIYDDEDVRIVEKLKVPFVNTSSSALGARFPTVKLDNYAIGRMAADHLADCDLDHFAFVGPTFLTHVKERYEGFVSALKPAMGECALVEYAPSAGSPQRFSTETVSPERLMALLEKLPSPIGIMAATDRIGFAVLEAFQRMGRRSPEDVALIGADNDEINCNLACTSMTSIDTRACEVGLQAAVLLDRLMCGNAPKETQILIEPRGVIFRNSTDKTRSKYPEVARALRFIRNYAHMVIDVTNVIDVVPVSRRWLEVKFKEEVGHGVYHEIRRVHVERAKDLLATTQWSISHIARESGFTTKERFDFAFEKVMGEAPVQYRKKHGKKA